MLVSDVLRHVQARLQSCSSTARLDAELLLAHGLNWSRAQVMAYGDKILDENQQQTINALIARRAEGEPVAYITGYKAFWNLRLQVSDATLIPRPETEKLVEVVLGLLPSAQALKVADLGTGCGAIALALASERPLWQVVGTDQSAQALRVAKINRNQLGLEQVVFYRGSWCSALPGQGYHAIVSNPPYIAPTDPHLERGGLKFEPKEALVAEEEGLAAIRLISEQARDYLGVGGWLVIEHGYEQGERVRKLFEQAGYGQIATVQDLAGQDRVSMGQWSSK